MAIFNNKSTFDLSNEVKTSTNIGQVTPFFWADVVPADEIKLSGNFLIRTMPLSNPILNRVLVNCKYFFIPYRLLIKDFTDILTDPDKDIVIPTVYDAKINTYAKIFSYFGIYGQNWSNDAKKSMSLLPLIAYQLIRNYYYIDPDTSPDYDDQLMGYDLPLDNSLTDMYYSLYRYDYFTNASTTTQYGDEVELDLNGDTTIKVTEMRLAERLQKLRENILNSGHKYTNILRSLFGVAPSDYEIQKPLLIGSNTDTLNISDVDSTANYNDGAEDHPLGSTAGKSVTYSASREYSYNAKEHGMILGLFDITPDRLYMAGVPRMFVKRDYYDFYNPVFADLGMQPINNTEVSVSNSNGDFAYTDRFAELKRSYDVVCGDFQKDVYSSYAFSDDISKAKFNFDFVHSYNNTKPFSYQPLSEPVGPDIFSYEAFVSEVDPDIVIHLIYDARQVSSLPRSIYLSSDPGSMDESDYTKYNFVERFGFYTDDDFYYLSDEFYDSPIYYEAETSLTFPAGLITLDSPYVVIGYVPSYPRKDFDSVSYLGDIANVNNIFPDRIVTSFDNCICSFYNKFVVKRPLPYIDTPRL